MLFDKRSHQKELLDNPQIPFGDIKLNMEELAVINRYLGGHRVTIQGIRPFLEINKYEILHIAEIGSGGGDNLRAIKKWAETHNYKVELTGIDRNKECISYAQGLPSNKGIHFICSDYEKWRWIAKPDVIFSSLFCHHFSDAELTVMLQWMKHNSKKGFFINDLHRHPAAYYCIKSLTQVFSKSYLVKNDAPLSVLRGFTRNELNNLCTLAGIRCNIKWRWAFRWLLNHSNAK
jgi:2-polyprenyl-3-methyl-5-hydroxy-6-metoxy-1,4-benzoquinol methylase